MGIRADFFVATPDDALKYAAPDSFQDAALKLRVAPAEYKSFTTVEVGTLWAILANEEWSVAKYDLIDESPEGEDESWLFRLPPALVELLAASTDEELTLATAKWAATEELSCAPSDLLPVTLDLHRLAKTSVDTGNPMYLWGSL